jgi:hypothetical protein
MITRQKCRLLRGGLRSAFLLATGLLVFVGESGAETHVIHDPQGHSVSIDAEVFRPRAGGDKVPFTRYEGSLFGLQQENFFSPRDFYPPFFNGGGIASGDINRDGWPDVVSANGALIMIYLNQNGQRFVAIELDVTGQDDIAIFNVALVDIDGDGWLDLFGTTYLQGNFYLLNDEGEFTSAGLRQLPRGGAVLSSTVSFGDVDRDGDLDVVVGNWFAGASKKHPPPRSQNELWINEDAEHAALRLER